MTIDSIKEQSFIHFIDTDKNAKSCTIIGHYFNTKGKWVYIMQLCNTNGNLQPLDEIEMEYVHKNIKGTDHA